MERGRQTNYILHLFKSEKQFNSTGWAHRLMCFLAAVSASRNEEYEYTQGNWFEKHATFDGSPF